MLVSILLIFNYFSTWHESSKERRTMPPTMEDIMYRIKTMLVLLALTLLFGVGLSAAAIHSIGKPNMVWESPTAQ